MRREYAMAKMFDLAQDEQEVIAVNEPNPIPVEVILQPESEVVGYEPVKTTAELAHDELRSIEDDIMRQAAEVIGGALSFTELSGMDGDMPPDWERKYGKAAADRRLIAARSAHMCAKEAPVGLVIAKQVFSSVVQARATDKMGPRTLNVAFVQMEAPLPNYKRLKVDT